MTFVKKLSSHWRALACCAAAIILAVIGISAAACSQQGTSWTFGGQELASQEPAAEEEAYLIDVSVSAEGWDAETSSKVIVHVEGDGVDFYSAIDANDPSARVSVAKAGDYTVSYISPINADGSIYRVPASRAASAVAESSYAAPSAPTSSLERVEAADATADDVNSILDQVSQAVAKGDSTLTGEAGQAVVDRFASNAEANPNADAAAVEEKSAEASSTAASGASAATGAASGSSSASTGSSSTGGSGSASGSSGSGGSSSASSGSNGSSSSASSSSSSSSSSHTHSWVAQTETVHHDAVTHQEPVYEYYSYSVCNGCGQVSPDSDHMYNHAINGEAASSHTEYEKRLTGYKTVTDQAAYDETVTTGYVCSTCGATK